MAFSVSMKFNSSSDKKLTFGLLASLEAPSVKCHAEFSVFSSLYFSLNLFCVRNKTNRGFCLTGAISLFAIFFQSNLRSNVCQNSQNFHVKRSKFTSASSNLRNLPSDMELKTLGEQQSAA